MERYLALKPVSRVAAVPSDVYQRIKSLEDRIVSLEKKQDKSRPHDHHGDSPGIDSDSSSSSSSDDDGFDNIKNLTASRSLRSGRGRGKTPQCRL